MGKHANVHLADSDVWKNTTVIFEVRFSEIGRTIEHEIQKHEVGRRNKTNQTLKAVQAEEARTLQRMLPPTCIMSTRNSKLQAAQNRLNIVVNARLEMEKLKPKRTKTRRRLSELQRRFQ